MLIDTTFYQRKAIDTGYRLTEKEYRFSCTASQGKFGHYNPLVFHYTIIINQMINQIWARHREVTGKTTPPNGVLGFLLTTSMLYIIGVKFFRFSRVFCVGVPMLLRMR
jgi:hypothetical protein